MGGLLSSRKRNIQGVYRAVLADRKIAAASVGPGQRLGFSRRGPSMRAYEDGHAASTRRLRLTALVEASWDRGGSCSTYLAGPRGPFVSRACPPHSPAGLPVPFVSRACPA